MHRLLPIFLFLTFWGLTSNTVFAQSVTYYDELGIKATAANYAYKRVVKYKEPIERLNIGTGYYGDLTINSTLSGLHICSLIDYYRTGEPALVATVISQNLDCSKWDFHGQAVWYYKNGNIKRKQTWKVGKLDGVEIFYDEKGNETKREEYVNGKLIEKGKFSVPADNPLLGTWKYVEYAHQGYVIGAMRIPPEVKKSITLTYSQNGVVASTVYNGLSTSTLKGNWRYTSKSDSSGVLEEYRGDELIERANVRWMSNNQFEYTVTFSQNPNIIGTQVIFTRQ